MTKAISFAAERPERGEQSFRVLNVLGTDKNIALHLIFPLKSLASGLSSPSSFALYKD